MIERWLGVGNQGESELSTMKSEVFDWSIGVFGKNESATLLECLRAISAAIGNSRAHVSVLLNGTTDDSARVAEIAFEKFKLTGQVVLIPLADKSNAINKFIYGLRPPSPVVFFVDAYAMVLADSFARLSSSLARSADAHAAAAVPSSGRSAAMLRKHMVADSGLHGSLFAVKGPFLDRVVESGLRLPIGLYRGDGLLGSMVKHDLNSRNDWDSRRIVVVPEATWRSPTLSPLNPADLRRWWRRQLNQARARVELRGLQATLYRGGGFGALPTYASQLRDRGAGTVWARCGRPLQELAVKLAPSEDGDASPKYVTRFVDGEKSA